MALDDFVDKVISKDKNLQRRVKANPRLKSRVRDIIAKSYEKNKGLVEWSRFTDKINAVLGPLEAGLRYFSPLGTVGFGIYSAAKLLHYGLVKLPYSIYYTLKTGDIVGSVASSLGEMAKYALPFGSVGDILPLNSAVADRYMLKDARQGLEDVLGEERPLPLPRELAPYNARVSDGHLYVDAPSPGYEVITNPLKNGGHEVYLRKKKGIFPNVITRLKSKLPRDLKRLVVPKKGFVPKFAAA